MIITKTSKYLAGALVLVVCLAAFWFFVSSSAAQSPQTVNLTVNKSSFLVGEGWILSLTTNPPLAAKPVTVCARQPAATCTPAANLGLAATTDSAGNWSASDTFDSSVIGSWVEYVIVDGSQQSGDVSFTVSPVTSPSCVINSPSSCIAPCNVGISWDTSNMPANSRDAMAVYRIQNGLFTKLGDFPASAAGNFTDANRPTGNYFYTIKGVDASGSETDSICTANTNVQATPVSSLTCSLSVSKTDICVGDTVTWDIFSDPSGMPAAWYGAKSGTPDATAIPAGASGVPASFGPYDCSTIGDYTRHASVSADSQTCTTNTVGVTVRDCTGVCGAAASAILPLAPRICTDKANFGSSCQQEQSVALNSTPAVDAQKQMDVTVYVKPPLEAEKNIIWSRAYLWRDDLKSWQPFSLQGQAHSLNSCANPDEGCWLTGNAYTQIKAPAAAARDGTFYVASWYYVQSGDTWQAGSCAGGGGACWVLLSVLDTEAIMEQIKQATSLEDALAIARAAGLTVQESFFEDIQTALIKHPITDETLVAISRASQLEVTGNKSGDVSECKTPGGRPLVVFGNNRIYGVHGNYNLRFNTDTLPTSASNRERMKSAIEAAVGSYDAVPDGPHSSGGHDSIVISWTPMNKEIVGEALTLSTKQSDGSFENTCLIHINTKYPGVGLSGDVDSSLDLAVQHEMGHCFGLAHISDPNDIMYFMMPSDPGLRTISQSMQGALFLLHTSSLGTLKINVTCTQTYCGVPWEVYDVTTGRCTAKTGGGSSSSPSPVRIITPPEVTKGCLDVRSDSEGVLFCSMSGGVDCNCSGNRDCTDKNGDPTAQPADACLFYGGGGGGSWDIFYKNDNGGGCSFSDLLSGSCLL